MNAHEQQATALIEAGKRDLLALQLLIESGRAPHETIGFHGQQAAEKFPKAVLVHHGVVFDRTHDLIVLHELLEQRGVQVPADKEKLRALNSYAVQFRYEGCPAEIVLSSECNALASNLEKWAEETLRSL
jgi:HEPN domain-containing protein